MTINQRYAFFLSALRTVLKRRYQIGLIFARDRDVFVVFRELHGHTASSCDDQTVKIKKRISSTTYGTGIHSAQTATVLMFIFNRSWCFNNLWRATCKLLMWAKSKTCKILDMRSNIKPNPRSTRLFLLSHFLLRFSQRCSMRKVRKRHLGRSLSATLKGVSVRNLIFWKEPSTFISVSSCEFFWMAFACSKYRYTQE